jgi:hypothetical protein
VAESRWVEIANHATQIEADFDRVTLEEAGIPVLVKGPMTGAFGPGFAGATMYGVRLYVPAELVDEAREILGAEPESDLPDDAA